MFPIDEIVDVSFEIFRPEIAVVDVIAVLPHIDAEDRRGAVHKRIFAVRGLHDLELAVPDRDPRPARTELRRSRIDEVGTHLVVAAEIPVDGLLQPAGETLAAAALL